MWPSRASVHGVRSDLLPHAALTPCRLRVEPDGLRRRLAARGDGYEDVEALVRLERVERAPAAEESVDTTGLSVAEVVDRVRARTGWPDLTGPVGNPFGFRRPLDTDDRPPDAIATEILQRTGWPSR